MGRSGQPVHERGKAVMFWTFIGSLVVGAITADLDKKLGGTAFLIVMSAWLLCGLMLVLTNG